MANERAFFYVGVMTNRNLVQWVTRVNNRERFAEWEEYRKAIPMPMYCAKDIVNGLRANGYHAIMVRETDETRLYTNRKVFDNGETTSRI